MNILLEHQLFIPMAKICVQNKSRIDETLNLGFEKLRKNFLLVRDGVQLMGEGLVLDKVTPFMYYSYAPLLDSKFYNQILTIKRNETLVKVICKQK